MDLIWFKHDFKEKNCRLLCIAVWVLHVIYKRRDKSTDILTHEMTPWPSWLRRKTVNLEIVSSILTGVVRIFNAFMAKLVRHLTSNEEIVSSNLAEGITFLYLEDTNNE